MSDQTEVVITLKDVYLEQQRTNALLAPLVDPQVGVVTKQADHEARLRRLEMKVYAVPGVMTMLSAAGLAWSIFGK